MAVVKALWSSAKPVGVAKPYRTFTTTAAALSPAEQPTNSP